MSGDAVRSRWHGRATRASPASCSRAGGALAGFAILGRLARGGLGGGDLKMGLLVGLVVGYGNLPLATLRTFLSGGLAANR